MIFILIAGYQIHSPAYYYQYFKENNVKHVVRLNSKKTYDAKRTFIELANIQHTDLVFTDGTPPSDSILKGFLHLCEQYIDDSCEVECINNEKIESNEITPNKILNSEANVAKYIGAVAVHCKGKNKPRFNTYTLTYFLILIFSWIGKNWLFSGFIYYKALVIYSSRSYSMDSYMSAWVSNWCTTTMVNQVRI